MYMLLKIRGFSLIGISIMGAIGHNIGQLIVASIIVKNIFMIGYLPFMLITSLVTGCFVGIVVEYCLPRVGNICKNPLTKNINI